MCLKDINSKILNCVFLIIMFMMVIGSLSTQAKIPHVHGQANGVVTLENSTIHIHITFPTESIIGFEHTPQTTGEKKIAANALTQLKTNNLFSFYKKASLFKKEKEIKAQSLIVEVDGLDPSTQPKKNQSHHHSHQHHNDPHDDDGNEAKSHSDVQLICQYTFDSLDNIDFVFTDLFTLFDGLEKVTIALISNNHQKELILDRNSPSFNLK